MATTDGNNRWQQQMATTDGNDECPLEMGTTNKTIDDD